MGRRKNNKSSDNNESSTKVSDSNPDRQQHNTITRFADAEEDDATASSILDDSVEAPVDGTAIEDEAMCDADVSMIDGEDDKTSADYYFDSYSHFGIYPFCILSLAETKWGFLDTWMNANFIAPVSCKTHFDFLSFCFCLQVFMKYVRWTWTQNSLAFAIETLYL